MHMLRFLHHMQRPPVQFPQVGRSLQAGVQADGLVPEGVNYTHYDS